MTDTDEFYELIKVTIDQAQYFLDRMGEFYPVSCVLVDGKVQPISLYEGEDYPDTKTYLSSLMEVLKNHESYAIALNVKTTFASLSDEPMDAIQIKTSYKTVEYVDYFMPYQILGENQIEYFDLTTLE